MQMLRAPRLRCAFALILLLLAGCSQDEATVQPLPEPHEGSDSIMFFVYTTEADGQERLRWIGTPFGPRADSPEGTEMPWIGFGRPFRIAWSADAEFEPVSGFQYRRSQNGAAPLFPRDENGITYWGADTTVVFTNSRDTELIGPWDCEEGPDCPEYRRWESGTHSFELLVRSGAQRVLAPELGLLSFRVNYPPVASLVLDRARDPRDTDASPVWTMPLLGGGDHTSFLSPGDTVPSGAVVQLRMQGRDRIPGGGFPDSFCCDLRLDETEPELYYHERFEMARVSVSDFPDTIYTLFGEATSDSLRRFEVGPYDYRVVLRGKDEHGRPSESSSIDFVAGYAPRSPELTPAQGAVGVLAVFDAPENRIEFRRESTTRYWFGAFREWSEADVGTAYAGVLYTIPLRFTARPHPALSGFDLSRIGSHSGSVRSFAYELHPDSDPANLFQNGIGDIFDYFLSLDRPDSLVLEGDEALQIFVPYEFVADPSRFDPSDPATDPERAEIGQRLQDLFMPYTFRSRSRTVDAESEFVLPLTRHGRVSEFTTVRFSLHLGLGTSVDQYEVWPPLAP